MKRKRLEKFLNKRCENIQNALTVFCLTRDPERIHQLRVETKKIVALVHLLDACSDHSREPLLKPLKKVYKKAALIRDAQVKLQLLAEEQVRNAAFEKEQKEIIAGETKRFCSEAARYQQKVEKVQKGLAAHLSGVETPCVLAAYRGWLGELAVFFSLHFTPDGLHDARKKIKDLLYIHAFLPASIKQELNLNRPYLDELQDSIGRWHDSVLTVEILSAQALAGDATITRLQEKNDKLPETIRSLSAGFIGNAKTKPGERIATEGVQ